MARIRTIKPEFFTSADTMDLSLAARLLYIGLWCEADREGRLAWRPAAFKVRYLPHDGVDIEAVCAELLAGGVVVLYGDGLAFIPTFTKHQVINGKEAPSRLPEPSRVTEIDSRVPDACLTRPGGRKEGKGREGKEGREGAAAVAAFPAPAPASVANDAWQETVADWNRAISEAGLPAVSAQPTSWRRIVAALKACPDLALWRRRYERVAASTFCRGRNDRGWTADFWWVLEHGDAIDSGRYDDKESARPQKVAGLTGGGVVARPAGLAGCDHEPRCETATVCRLKTMGRVVCPTCDGVRYVDGADCPTCQASGSIRASQLQAVSA